ncbi:MAG: hypothetical protein BGO14_06435 [Chlamydiales bacterium 38-26]|nr:hypothetical protein [Chlamydiales bacterium]OJV08522.1 MAG: hypothetical protein BGO14_06435 [Chlamydiales bacterium 38-26]
MSKIEFSSHHLTAVESHSNLGALAAKMAAWNNDPKHKILGPIGARVVGFVGAIFASLADFFMHLALASGKSPASLAVLPFRAGFKLPRDLHLSSPLVHLMQSIHGFFNTFIAPLLMLIDPDRAYRMSNKTEAELHFHKKHAEALKQQVKAQNLQIDNLSKITKHLNGEIEKLDQEVEKLKGEIKDVNGDFTKLQQELDEKKDEIQELTTKKNAHDEQLKELGHQKDLLEKQLAEHVKKQQESQTATLDLAQKMTLLRDQKDQFEQSLKQKEDELHAALKESEEKSQCIKNLESEIENYKNTLADVKKELQECHEQLKGRLKENSDSTTVKDLQGKLEIQKKQIEEATKKSNQTQLQLTALQNEKIALKQQLDDLHHKYSQLKGEIETKEKLLGIAEQTQENLETQLGSLQKSLKNKEIDIAILTASNEDSEPYIVPPLNLSSSVLDGSVKEINHEVLNKADQIFGSLSEESSNIPLPPPPPNLGQTSKTSFSLEEQGAQALSVNGSLLDAIRKAADLKNMVGSKDAMRQTDKIALQLELKHKKKVDIYFEQRSKGGIANIKRYIKEILEFLDEALQNKDVEALGKLNKEQLIADEKLSGSNLFMSFIPGLNNADDFKGALLKYIDYFENFLKYAQVRMDVIIKAAEEQKKVDDAAQEALRAEKAKKEEEINRIKNGLLKKEEALKPLEFKKGYFKKYADEPEEYIDVLSEMSVVPLSKTNVYISQRTNKKINTLTELQTTIKTLTESIKKSSEVYYKPTEEYRVIKDIVEWINEREYKR